MIIPFSKRLLVPGFLLNVLFIALIQPLPAQEQKNIPLRIGFVYQANIIDHVIQYQPLFDYLEKYLPVKIEPIWYSTGYQLLMDLNNGSVDVVFTDGATYLYAREKLQARQVAVVKVKGEYSRRAVVVVRKDSGLENYLQLRGKRMALVGPLDVISSLWMRGELEKISETLDSFFKSVIYTNSPVASILNVVIKEVEAAVVEEKVFLYAQNTNPKIRETLKTIKFSSAFSNQVVVAGKILDATFLKKLKAILVTMNNTLEGNGVLASIRGDGFFPQKDDLFVNDLQLMKFFPQSE